MTSSISNFDGTSTLEEKGKVKWDANIEVPKGRAAPPPNLMAVRGVETTEEFFRP
jgi:hypothetical protein